MTDSFAKALLTGVLLIVMGAIGWTHIQKKHEAQRLPESLGPNAEGVGDSAENWIIDPIEDSSKPDFKGQRPARRSTHNSSDTLRLFVRQIELERALLNETDMDKKAAILAQIESATNNRHSLYQGNK